MNDPDKSATNKDMTHQSPSFWKRIKTFICPCFISNADISDESILYGQDINPINPDSKAS